MSTNANFGWVPTVQEISNVDLVLIMHQMSTVPCGAVLSWWLWGFMHLVQCTHVELVEGEGYMETVPSGVWHHWENRYPLLLLFEVSYIIQAMTLLSVLLTVHTGAHC